MSHETGIFVGWHSSPSTSVWSVVGSVSYYDKRVSCQKKNAGHRQLGTDPSDCWIDKKAYKDAFDIFRLQSH